MHQQAQLCLATCSLHPRGFIQGTPKDWMLHQGFVGVKQQPCALPCEDLGWQQLAGAKTVPSTMSTTETIKIQCLCLALFYLLVELCPVTEKIISSPRLETYLLFVITQSSLHPTLALPLSHSWGRA